jgi:hypothetical protein
MDEKFFCQAVLLSRLPGMGKLLIWIGVFIGGWVGWWLGEKLGFGLFGKFFISNLGSIVGVFTGWKIANEL